MYAGMAVQRICIICSLESEKEMAMRESGNGNLHFLYDMLSNSCPGPFLTQRVAKANSTGVLKRLKQHPRAGGPEADRVKKAGTTK